MKAQLILSPIRLGLVLSFFALCTMGLVIRLWYLQVYQHESFVQQAQNAHWDQETVTAPRGSILDSEGNPLALSLASWEVTVDPSEFTKPEQRENAVRVLAAVSGFSSEDLESTIDNGSGNPVLAIPHLDYERGKLLAATQLPGVTLQENSKRTYPEGSLAAPLIGFLGRDGAGLTGLEADLNPELAGTPGSLVFERDSVGNPIPLGYRATTNPEEGHDIVLTVDRYVQRVIERELDEAMTRHEAEGGTIIVMDPRTGGILAMASRPTFDLQNLSLADEEALALVRNRAVTDLYEPGSTFKVLTMAAAINEGLVTPETTYVDAGPVMKYGYTIDTWDGNHWGKESMADLLMHSNNVGAVWLSDQLGQDIFYKYVNAYGFGKPTNVGLSGEANGQVRMPDNPNWSPIDLATNAFGQGLSVTPLQLVTAVSGVINDGVLMKPQLVKGLVGADGMQTIQPQIVRRLVSSETSRQIRSMMRVVAEDGPSKLATVPGFHVGGKTGTATIPGPDGKYLEDATIASIVGFFPYENPRAVVLVKIDHPKDSPWGGQIASPIFSNIARELLIYWRIPPSDGALAARIP